MGTFLKITHCIILSNKLLPVAVLATETHEKSTNINKYIISAGNLTLTKRTISIQYHFNYFMGNIHEEKSLNRRIR